MSSRSMNYLRKNSKVVLVVMGIVCMITFVIGAALSDLASYARSNAENPNPVVVTWAKGKVHGDELQMMRYRHAKAYQFLYMVIRTAIERGGKPMVNGRPVAMDRMQNIDVGISQDNSEESAIQTMVLAEEARRMGVVVDLDAVKNYLRQISAPELKEGDWHDIATQIVGQDKKIAVSQLLEHVAYELRAEHVRTLALAGFFAQGVGPIVPPGEAFELFSRLNRKFAIEAYPIEVQNFVSEVKAEPTPAEVQKLFDEGKQRDPDPTLDEPGFHKPHRLAFKWLKVSFTPFLDEAQKQITDAQIEEAYQKDISQGLHKVLELPASTPGAEGTKEAEKSAEDKPATDKPATEKPADAAASPPATEAKPDSDKPAEPKAEDKPAASKRSRKKISRPPRSRLLPTNRPKRNPSPKSPPSRRGRTISQQSPRAMRSPLPLRREAAPMQRRPKIRSLSRCRRCARKSSSG
jgi:hypothetical protein